MSLKQPHICVSAEDIPEQVLICGDPARVNRIAELLEDARNLAENREYRLIKGLYNQKPVVVCSTGIGAPSTLIALEELRLCGAKKVIRVGSAGALQKGIALGELIIVDAAVRDEGASKAYLESSYPASADRALATRMESFALAEGHGVHCGIVRSHDSFYTDAEDKICEYWSRQGVLAADMETAALLTVGRLRGMKTAAILNTVVLYQQDVQQGIAQYADAEQVMMKGEIFAAKTALEALTR